MIGQGFARAIAAICLTVPDLDAAESFYRDALGFTLFHRVGRLDSTTATALGAPEARISSSSLRLGAQTIELLAFDPPGRPYPPDSTSSDLWFQHCAIVVGDMAAAYAHVLRFSPSPITQGGPRTLPPNTGGVAAFKFRDPFGHPLELLQFPPGVGDAGWHRRGEPSLFRGIDHSAIAVGDAERSIRFYERTLGFRVTGRSHNAGAEQSTLDAIAHDRVDVVALSAERQPPHLELLAYRAGTRRPRPADWHPADAAVTRTIIELSDSDRPRHPSGDLASGGRVPDPASPDQSGAAVLDPDQHLLILRHRTA